MEAVIAYTQAFFGWLMQTTLIASLVICLILLIQKILGGKLGPRWSHALWLVLLIRMILPWAPSSRMSLLNLIPSWDRQIQHKQQLRPVEQQTVSPTEQTVGTSEVTTSQKSETESAVQTSVVPKPSMITGTESESKPRLVSIRRVLPILWLAGAIVIGAYLLVSNFALWRIVKRDRPLLNQAMLELFEECKAQMGVQSLVVVVPSDRVRSPGLFGFVRPRLLLPREMLDTATTEEMRYVFLHELAHLKRHDIYLGWLTSLLQVLHWFNPLVWFAFYRMRADRELACDALVLTRTGQDKSHEYGGAIVGLVRRFSRCRPLPAMAGIMESKSQLKRRIAMITQFKKNSYRWSPLSVIFIVMLGCVSVPSPKQDSHLQISALKQHSGMTLKKLKEQWGGFANISPDGKYLCDVDWNASGDLVVRELVTGRQWSVTKKGSWENSFEYGLDSAISPDNKRVAYLWYDPNMENSNLYMIDIDGSERRLLRRNEYLIPRDWSSDGKRILGILFGETKEMVWVSSSDGSIQRIKAVGKGYPGKFDVSPDGRYIAYDLPQEEGSEKRDIFVFVIEENREIPLAQNPAHDKLLGWTPDGKHIFFASDRMGSWDGWLMNVVDGKPKGLPKLAKSEIGNIQPIGFTLKGDYYFGIYHNRYNVYTTMFDLQKGMDLSAFKTIGSAGTENLPDWSPDGHYLAYCTGLRDDQVIRIRSLATGQERELDPNLPFFYNLCWSPDGQSLLASGFRDNKTLTQVVYKIDAQTGEYTALSQTQKGEIRQATLSLDGRSLFYKQEESIVVKDIETDREKEIFRTMPPMRLRDWALSPDGRRLVFSLSGKKGSTLKTLSATGGEPSLLFDENWTGGKQKFEIHAVTWMHNSKSVLFRINWQGEKRGDELWWISAEGGEPQKLWVSKKPFGWLRVHPDGQRIAFTQHDLIYELWVMENFLPEEMGK